jgi:hypothetical protein
VAGGRGQDQRSEALLIPVFCVQKAVALSS